MKKSKNKSRNKKLPAKKSSYLVILLSFLFIFIFLSSALIFTFFTSTNTPLTGAVSAEGGNVTYANVSAAQNAGFWQGYFGEITVDASASTPSATARRGNITELNLILPCVGNEIYAGTQNSIDFQNISAGTKESVDIFLNLSSSHLESGSNVFTTTRDFVVSSTLITAVPATYMKVSGSLDGPFALGVLNQSNVLVFVNNVSINTIGFDGNTHDYQIMIPVNQSELTYYFFSDCEVVPTPPAAPTPEAPSAAPRAGKSLIPPEEKPIVIGIVEKEGKLLLTGYPIAITVLKGDKKSTTIEVINIGEGKVENIYLFVTGLPLDTFTITPPKYGRLLSNEKQVFLVEFQGNLEAGIYPIQVVVVSEQGSSFIEGVLIVKDIQKEQKLPLAGAATGLAGKYNTLLLLLLLLILLFLAITLWHLLAKNRGRTYHSCTIEDLLHHHEENACIEVIGRIKPLGKGKEDFFCRLEDKSGWIDVLTDTPLTGRVKIKGIVQRDAEEHKFIKAIEIKELFQKKKLKKKRA